MQTLRMEKGEEEMPQNGEHPNRCVVFENRMQTSMQQHLWDTLVSFWA